MADAESLARDILSIIFEKVVAEVTGEDHEDHEEDCGTRISVSRAERRRKKTEKLARKAAEAERRKKKQDAAAAGGDGSAAPADGGDQHAASTSSSTTTHLLVGTATTANDFSTTQTTPFSETGSEDSVTGDFTFESSSSPAGTPAPQNRGYNTAGFFHKTKASLLFRYDKLVVYLTDNGCLLLLHGEMLLSTIKLAGLKNLDISEEKFDEVLEKLWVFVKKAWDFAWSPDSFPRIWQCIWQAVYKAMGKEIKLKKKTLRESVKNSKKCLLKKELGKSASVKKGGGRAAGDPTAGEQVQNMDQDSLLQEESTDSPLSTEEADTPGGWRGLFSKVESLQSFGASRICCKMNSHFPTTLRQEYSSHDTRS